MKLTPATRRLLPTIIAALICGSVAMPQSSYARQGATDPIPGTSNGSTNTGGGSGGGGGGGGGKSSTTTTTTTATTTTAPAPAPQPLVSAALTFTAAGAIGGVTPNCTGVYRIDPYYPTLSLATISAQVDSLNVPDGTTLYMSVTIAGGTGYPFTSNAIPIVARGGSCMMNEYITLGSTITGVIISDVNGTVIFAGK